MRIPVVYSQVMVADSQHAVSSSAQKPALVAAALREQNYPIDFVDPEAVSIEDIQRVHEPSFVTGILQGRIDNGFGNRSAEIARSLPYTTGSMLTAAKIALLKKRAVVASLSSGFHHAGWNQASGFCTFNGLMVTAATLIQSDVVKRIAIIDVDYHYGDGTDNILAHTGLAANVFHVSLGKDFTRASQAEAYLERMRSLETDLARFSPDLILYSAGVDTHVDDPLGGVLTTEQLGSRDEIMFQQAKRLGIPVAFNLAGGYLRDELGTIKPVVKLHLNTFSAALRAHDFGASH